MYREESFTVTVIVVCFCFIMLLCFSWQEISPLTSGRLSHSSGPLNCLTEETDSPPVSPSEEFEDVVKVIINKQ